MDIQVNGVSFNRHVVQKARSAEALAKSLPNVFKGHEKRAELFAKVYESVHEVKKTTKKTKK